jgi:hypothetical protein
MPLGRGLPLGRALAVAALLPLLWGVPLPALKPRPLAVQQCLWDAIRVEECGFLAFPTEWWHFDGHRWQNQPLVQEPGGL